MRLDSSSNLHVANDVVGFSSTLSDLTLKDNVSKIDNALDKVLKLRGVQFDWNNTSKKGTHDIGVVAQEVEAIFPELVKTLESPFLTEGEDATSVKAVAYDRLVGVLIEAIRELNEKINNK